MIVYIDSVETGKNIKFLMAQSKITIKDIEKQCCVTNQAVYKWLNGMNVPSIDNLVILSMLFNCKIDDIIARDYRY